MRVTSEDLRLLEFKTYDDYLKSLFDAKNVQYLGKKEHVISLNRSGYRALTEDAYELRKSEITQFLYATKDQNVLFSRNIHPRDKFLIELANRERSNRVGLLSTIIYIRYKTRRGEMSGYIDFEEALRRVKPDQLYPLNWRAIFNGEKILHPCRVDLIQYNVRTDRVIKNNSSNYQIICDPHRGLIFRNVFDRKAIIPDPVSGYYGTNTTRTEVTTDLYEQVALYDHVVRKNF